MSKLGDADISRKVVLGNIKHLVLCLGKQQIAWILQDQQMLHTLIELKEKVSLWPDDDTLMKYITRMAIDRLILKQKG